jgi:hypothetical protein
MVRDRRREETAVPVERRSGNERRLRTPRRSGESRRISESHTRPPP